MRRARKDFGEQKVEYKSIGAAEKADERDKDAVKKCLPSILRVEERGERKRGRGRNKMGKDESKNDEQQKGLKERKTQRARKREKENKEKDK